MAEFWSNNDRGYRIRLWVDQVGQNIQNNTSQVRLRLALLNTTTTFAQYSCSAFVDFNGQRLNWSGSPNVLGWNQTIQLIDQTITVSHADDGSGVFGVHAHFNGSGGWSPRSLDIGNQGITLTTIPRGSAVRVPEGFIGNQIDITIDRKIANATHTLRYDWYNKKGKISDNVGTSFKWTIPSDFANDIPNSTTGQGTIYIDTYIDGKFIQTQSAILTASVVTNNLKPSFNGLTLSDANTTTQRIIPEQTHFVSIRSLVKVVFNGAQAQQGATITGYYAEIVGANNSISSNGGVFREVAVSKDTQMTLRGRVQDSRGIWSDWKEMRITFLYYFSPTLKFEVTRSGDRLDTLTIKRFAKIAPLTVNGAQRNIMKLTFTTTKVGTSDIVSDNGSAGGEWSNISELNASNANLGNEYPADTSFIITGKLEDEFTSASFQATLPTDEVIMTYDRKGVGIGKYRERGALDVAGDIYANDKLIQLHQLTNKDGTAIDDFFTDFNYNVSSGYFQKSSEAKNSPSRTWGFLMVVGGGNNLVQYFSEKDGSRRLFLRSKTNGYWTDWVEYAKTDHTNLINTGWQYAGFEGSFYKRVGDVLTFKYDFTGNGSTMYIGNIPSSIWVAPQSYMLVIAKWTVDGSDNSHVQINQGASSLNVLNTGNGTLYRGQLTIMI